MPMPVQHSSHKVLAPIYNVLMLENTYPPPCASKIQNLSVSSCQQLGEATTWETFSSSSQLPAQAGSGNLDTFQAGRTSPTISLLVVHFRFIDFLPGQL